MTFRSTDIPEGTEVTIVIRGRIKDVEHGHGLCYLVEFPQKDYVHPRELWLDADEVEPKTLTTASQQIDMIFGPIHPYTCLFKSCVGLEWKTRDEYNKHLASHVGVLR